MAIFCLWRYSLLLLRLELALGAQMLIAAVPNVKSWVTAQHKESPMLAAGQGVRTTGKHFVAGMG